MKQRTEKVPYELTYLEGGLMDSYIHDVAVVQGYAELNRTIIIREILKSMKWKISEINSVCHNFISDQDGSLILRKGAISASKGEFVVIPINMRDGMILGTGLGNAGWNCSAPHGSGRIQKREDVRKSHTVSEYKAAMKGIYSSCVGASTLDEAPFAYRGIDEIAEAIKPTVRIEKIIRPVYSYKAGGEEK